MRVRLRVVLLAGMENVILVQRCLIVAKEKRPDPFRQRTTFVRDGEAEDPAYGTRSRGEMDFRSDERPGSCGEP